MTEPTNIVGPDSIRSGKNTSGSEIAKGTIVKLAATPTVRDEIEPAGAVTDAFYGVAMEDIPDDGWGNVQVNGKAIVLGGDDVAVGARVTSTAAGKGDEAAAGNAVLGIAVTAGADGELFEVELTGPGGTEMPG